MTEKHATGNRTIVVIAEDDPDDRLLIRDALMEAACTPVEVVFVHDGAELLEYLRRRGEPAGPKAAHYPELVLLDLNLPKKGGLEVLEEIKHDAALRSIPVVVLTTSRSPEHVARSYELGGNGYITKPDTYKELVQVMVNLDRYWFQTVLLP